MKHKNEKPILPKPEVGSIIQTTTVPQTNPPATNRTPPPQVVHVNPNGSPPDLLQGKSSNSGQNISVSQGASHGGIFISNFNSAGSAAAQAVVLPDVFQANPLNQSTASFPQQPNQFPHPQQPSNTSQTASQNNFTDSTFNTSGQSDLSFTDSSFNTSGNQSTLSFESNTSFGSLNAESIDLVSLSKDLQSSIKCTLPSSQASFTSTQGGFQYQQDQHGASYRQQMDVMNPEPRVPNIQPTDLNFTAQGFDQNMVISSQAMSQQPSGFTQSTAFHPQQPYNHPIPSQPTQFQPDITNQTQHETIPDLLNFTPTSDYGISSPKAFQHDSPAFYDQMQMNQQGSTNSNSQPQEASASGEPVWNTSSVSSTSPSYTANSPGLKVDCSSPERKPSNQTNSQLQPDLIALLSKQMSKSLLDNIMPPSLSLTPRGTGAGYGVGMDMDALLVQAQVTSDSGTQSPLSSSLLADWLEVTGGNLIADIQDLEQEMSTQSPLPFPDL
ncbi:hypothetical protein LOTGIDRAFT_231514 [Lottia gigantea]|uniref:Uncharacterized protein n=1 Tax=Lottia gigantea TaxID=225164 RepID=V4AU62_LOTGI|nr:hypothetical protein LOTGIDRAFT_231514 [Lottia gigantea]ESO97316.1 hypothetical protein LOTGIDRAFT_231514 [Lottia gigantea]